MKRLILLVAAAILTSCVDSNSKVTMKKEKCVVTESFEVERYGGVLPEKDYFVKTDCGYSMPTRRQCNVGDTIVITVHYISKN